jgi:hypothetical protein
MFSELNKFEVELGECVQADKSTGLKAGSDPGGLDTENEWSSSSTAGAWQLSCAIIPS